MSPISRDFRLQPGRGLIPVPVHADGHEERRRQSAKPPASSKSGSPGGPPRVGGRAAGSRGHFLTVTWIFLAISFSSPFRPTLTVRMPLE